MKTSYAGLITRGRCFYVRFALPKRYWCLTKCHEIGYSLDTCSYEQAIRKWRFELYHFQRFMKTFEEVCMKVESGKVLLDTTDVDKVLLFELERKQFLMEEKADEIADGSVTEKDVELYDKNETSDKIKQLMEQVILEYLQDLIVHQKANATLRTIYKKLKDKEVALGLVEQDDSGYQWFSSLTRQMGALQRYLRKSVESIREDKPYSPTNPKITSLLRTYDEKKTKERLTTTSSHTNWEKVFKKFIANKKNLKGLGDARASDNKRALKICFALIGKDLESITQQDCRKLCDNLYRVPKRWSGELEQGETIFQTFSPTLQERLQEVLSSQDSRIGIGVPISAFAKSKSRFWTKNEKKYIQILQLYINKNQMYFPADITALNVKSEWWFNKMRQVWENRNVHLIHGKGIFDGFQYDIFDNAKSVTHQIAPNRNAFEQYDAILKEALKTNKDDLIIIVLGPTATVLAYDLAKQGYQALDLGHIAKNYDWYMRGKKGENSFYAADGPVEFE